MVLGCKYCDHCLTTLVWFQAWSACLSTSSKFVKGSFSSFCISSIWNIGIFVSPLHVFLVLWQNANPLPLWENANLRSMYSLCSILCHPANHIPMTLHIFPCVKLKLMYLVLKNSNFYSVFFKFRLPLSRLLE